MRCPWCGNRNAPTATVCATCGKDIASAESTADAIRRLDSLQIDEPELDCPRCGAANFATAQFCSLCHAELVSGSAPKRTSAPKERKSLGQWLTPGKLASIAFGLMMLGAALMSIGNTMAVIQRGDQRVVIRGIEKAEPANATPPPASGREVIVVPLPTGSRGSVTEERSGGGRIYSKANFVADQAGITVFDYYEPKGAGNVELARGGWQLNGVYGAGSAGRRFVFYRSDGAGRLKSSLIITVKDIGTRTERRADILFSCSVADARSVRYGNGW